MLGRRWTTLVKALAHRLQFKLEVSALPDGTLVPVPTLSFRSAPSPTALDVPLRHVVEQRRPHYESQWKSLTALQQNCLRAVAAGEPRLTTARVLARFSLGTTSRTAKTLTGLADRDILVRNGTRYTFDDPFFRAWVIESSLPDVGLSLPITYLPPVNA